MKDKKILIIDDDADIRIGLNARLRAHGFETAFAEDCIGAVSTARKENPDLILLDIGLPGGDGFLVLQRLRANTQLACIPVIVITARDPHENESRAIKEGAAGFFQKPVDNDELLGCILRELA